MDESRTILLAATIPDGGRRDLAIEIKGDARTSDLIAALADEIGADAPGLVARLDGRLLTAKGDEPVAALGLVHGAELVLGRAGTEREGTSLAVRATTVLSVAGGPAAGQRFDLQNGEHTVGRDEACTVVVDDPSLSRNHLLVHVGRDGVRVEDAGSTNGTFVEGRRLAPGDSLPIAPGTLISAGRSELVFVVPVRDHRPAGDARGRIPFNRPPRFVRRFEPSNLKLEAPPDEPGKVRLPLGAAVLPLVLGVVLWIVTKSPLMLLFSLLSPVMAVWSFVEDRRGGKRAFSRRSKAFREMVAHLTEELGRACTLEADAARASSPSASELVTRAHQLLPELWERREDDDDFLAVRVGAGSRAASTTVQLASGGAAELRHYAEIAIDRFRELQGVPVVASLRELGGLGLVGGPEQVRGLARWLVAQAATLHSPRELLVAAAVTPDRTAEWEWLKWLPHTRVAGADLDRMLAVGPEQATELVGELARLAQERRRVRKAGTGLTAVRGWPSILVLIEEEAIRDRSVLTGLLGDAVDAGIAVLWLGASPRTVPNGCRAVCELDPELARLTLADTRDGTRVDDVVAEGMPLDVAERLARDLAPVSDVGGERGSVRLPTEIMLLELLRAESFGPAWVDRAWQRMTDERRAVLGISADGSFSVDLRADGPHALIAGTTGSGKSELLQTLVASLALAFPPNRLSFLLVDYKGGAAFKECVHLPHTVGMVTDLDGHLAQRALISLNAELRARETFLREHGAKDLLALERRDPELAPPDLLIVIDEFATLVKEVPDFVTGIVDVAQRGRSLGVHLVLATQRPGGVVSDNIRANTNLRIALRVNEPAESSDVIGSESASRIRRDLRGRAFGRTGHGEITEFQTAYVGGSTRTGGRPVRVARFTLGGTEARGDRTVIKEDATDLARIVAATRDAWQELGRPALRPPWLPPLPVTVPLASLSGVEVERRRGAILLGLRDEPERQCQTPLAVDLESDGSVLVFGASGSGKTTVLRTLASDLAVAASPRDVHLYGIDFATRGLLSLERLPHCGCVIPAEDPERIERLFAVLRRELTRRKDLLSRAGAASLSTYRSLPGSEEIARTVVLLDGYAGFHATFEKVNLGELVDELPRLVSEGRPLGVHFAITADRRGSVPSTLSGLIGRRLVLRMADPDEFSALGVNPKLVKDAFLPAGRGFCDELELQIAVVGSDASGEAQAQALHELGAELRERYAGQAAPTIQTLPERVTLAELPPGSRPLEAVIGIADDDHGPARVDLEDGSFAVIGPYRSGKSTALAALAASLSASSPGVALQVLAPRRSPLVELGLWSAVASGAEACAEAACQLADALAAGGVPRTVLFVDDAEELVEGPAATALEQIVRRGRDAGVTLVTATERQAAQRAYGWLRDVRKDEHGLFLDPDVDMGDGDMLGVRLPRRTTVVFPAGRGYLVRRGMFSLIQIAVVSAAGR